METLTQQPSAGTADAATGSGSNGAAPQIQNVPLGEIVRSPFNRSVDTKSPAFAELVDSIRQHGVIQPGLARPLPSALDSARKPGVPRLELVIGEHRWLGSAKAGKPAMPLIVRQLTDVEVVELQTIENDKRKDLSPIEEAEKYQQLIDQYEKAGLKKETAIAKLCEKLSKGKSTVYEALRLLKLPAEAKAAVKSGKLPPSHAGLLAKVENDHARTRLLQLVAPEDPQSHEIHKLESSFGLYCVDRDDAGLLPFRDLKEVVEEEISRDKDRDKWEKLAAAWRAKGKTVLAEEEIAGALSDYGKGKGIYLSGDDSTIDYSKDYTYQAFKTLMGRHAPPPILTHDRDYKPVELYLRKEAYAAIAKNGRKKVDRRSGSSGGGQSVAAREKEEKRRALEKRMQPVAAAAQGLLKKASTKTRKFPWAVFLRWFSDIGIYLPESKTKAAGKSEKTALAFLAAEMVGDIVDNSGAWDVSRGDWDDQFAELCQHYGIDLGKLTKELAPPPPKKAKQKTAKKTKVQTPGGAVAETPSPKKAKGGLTPTARQKLADAMKARWAARRKAAPPVGGKK